MKREIKFRQPIFVSGKFDRWHQWGFIGQNFGGIASSLTTSIEEAQAASQQYTGLKDANNIDIYEGDILQYFHDTRLRFPKTVKWDSGRFGITGQGYGFKSLRDCEIDQYSVIGNIYENPELLKQ